ASPKNCRIFSLFMISAALCVRHGRAPHRFRLELSLQAACPKPSFYVPVRWHLPIWKHTRLSLTSCRSGRRILLLLWCVPRGSFPFLDAFHRSRRIFLTEFSFA